MANWWVQSEGVILFGTLAIVLMLVYFNRKERIMAYKKKNGKGGKKK